MKFLKLLLTIIVSVMLLSSCVIDNRTTVVNNASVYLNELITDYDIWYVDIHKTNGTAEIPFLQKAFTVSFDGGILYANNNIVEIGITGNGYGIKIGQYNVIDNVLETSHRQGYSDFEVIQISDNEIRLNDLNQNVSYYLVGYQINNFDYDRLFYDNIEFFLQEYVAWERTEINGGIENIFDRERYLSFEQKNDKIFYSSKDQLGKNIETINWDYIGNYEIQNYSDTNKIKHLTLYYDNNDTEEFDLFVINDSTIRFKHLNTNTNYDFVGKGFIEYLRRTNDKIKIERKKYDRNRRKIERKTIRRN